MSEPAQVIDFQQARARRTARDNEPWVNKRRIALHFGKSTRTIETWVKTRGMPHRKPFANGHVSFRISECDRWFERLGS